MADEQLRELERRARLGDEPEAEVGQLVARVRSGDLSRDRLRFAWFLGHEAAARAAEALGLERPELSSDEPLRVTGWVHALPGFWRGHAQDEEWPWFLQVYRRVGAALVHVTLRLFTEDAEGLEWATAVGDRMDEWVVAGPGADPAPALVALEADVERPESWLRRVLGRRRRQRSLRAVLGAAASASVPDREVNAAPRQAAEILAEELGEEAVRAALVRELLPWALERGDPVRIRVAKRGEVEVTPEDLG
ncbi:MAG: hypothetical protein AB7N76_04110 [Planctomycetota bacterium]